MIFMKTIQMYAISDTGLVREHNEDCVCIHPEFGFAVLADGLGGHHAGEVASQLAVHAISDDLSCNTDPAPPVRRACRALALANTRVHQMAQQPEYAGMGTTVVLALFVHAHITLAHIGDSRAYRFRNGVLTAMTKDHSFVQKQVDHGLMHADEARLSPYRHLVTRAVGLDREVQASVTKDSTMPADIYLMCSDGLSDFVPDEAIRQSLLQTGPALEEKAAALVRLANTAGGPDNISAILIRTP